MYSQQHVMLDKTVKLQKFNLTVRRTVTNTYQSTAHHTIHFRLCTTQASDRTGIWGRWLQRFIRVYKLVFGSVLRSVEAWVLSRETRARDISLVSSTARFLPTQHYQFGRKRENKSLSRKANSLRIVSREFIRCRGTRYQYIASTSITRIQNTRVKRVRYARLSTRACFARIAHESRY
jgi:hypothetical protein